MKFEDVGDIGTEYTFIPVPGDIPVYSEGDAKIEIVRKEKFVTEYKVTVNISIPESSDSKAEAERNSVTPITGRSGGRSEKYVTIPVTYIVSLYKQSRRLDVRVEFENTAKDHRLRVLFPTGLNCMEHKAESVFEAALRNNKHKDTWTYPSGCEHQQGYVMMSDEASGLAVANKGLYEYEITDNNTIAVTLVRAVAELGDWGVFPTELSQQQKKLSLELSVIPYEDEDLVYTEAASFQCPVTALQILNDSDNALKNNQVVWNGNDLRMTAFKASLDGNDIVMRFVNFADEERVLTINKSDWINNLMLSNVIEEDGEMLQNDGVEWNIKVKPFEIVTLKTKYKYLLM